MMRIIHVLLVVLMFPGNAPITINDEKKLNFPINTTGVFDDKVQLYYSLISDEQQILSSNFDEKLSFERHFKPLDVFTYDQHKGEDQYYSLLTKTVYGLPQHVTFFSKERLSDPRYLKKVMPYNEIIKSGNDYHLTVGFGAPDISYTLSFFTSTEFQEVYPGLAEYFHQFDGNPAEPNMVVVQHNHTFGKVLGQKTSKMSISVTRYYDAGDHQTLAVNYTLSYIYNLPPAIFGGSTLLINQMKKGIVALVRDTRAVCQENHIPQAN